ncbi:MAG: polysaccharide biosynthesis/export family protein [Planctomycetota bacterium]
MSPVRRTLSLLLALWVAAAPALLAGCSSLSTDKRILQHAIKSGLGKRYHGNAQEENYVSIGDAVTYVDTYNPEVKGTGIVDIDGTILLPEAGAVSVAGLTRSEVETKLTQKLSPYYVETDVRVMIQTGPNKIYYVLGEVSAPGPKPFRGDLNILDAVLLANPREHSSNLSRVRLIRADPVNPLIMRSDLSAIWEYGDPTTNYTIQEYDIIYVPPTVLQSLADFVSGIIVPFTSVVRSVFQMLFFIEYGDRAFLGRNRYF